MSERTGYLKENEVPKHVLVMDELLYTDNNKYDFRYYEDYGKKYVEDKE